MTAYYPRCAKPDCAICKDRDARAQRAADEARDTERIRRELLERLNEGGPEFADAVAHNLTINAAASLLDAIAEALREESR